MRVDRVARVAVGRVCARARGTADATVATGSGQPRRSRIWSDGGRAATGRHASATRARGAACAGPQLRSGRVWVERSHGAQIGVCAAHRSFSCAQSAAVGKRGRWYTQESFSRHGMFFWMRNRAGSPESWFLSPGERPGFSDRGRVRSMMKASPMAPGSVRHEAGRTRRFPDIFTRARCQGIGKLTKLRNHTPESSPRPDGRAPPGRANPPRRITP